MVLAADLRSLTASSSSLSLSELFTQQEANIFGQKIPGQRGREAGSKGRSRKREGDRHIGWTQEEQRGGK